LDVVPEAIWILDDEDAPSRTILLNWGRWTLEPVGAGWPEDQKLLGRLGKALQMGASKRPELADVKIAQAELAALAFALERECVSQRYNQAMELMPRILERLISLEL